MGAYYKRWLYEICSSGMLPCHQAYLNRSTGWRRKDVVYTLQSLYGSFLSYKISNAIYHICKPQLYWPKRVTREKLYICLEHKLWSVLKLKGRKGVNEFLWACIPRTDMLDPDAYYFTFLFHINFIKKTIWYIKINLLLKSCAFSGLKGYLKTFVKV